MNWIVEELKSAWTFVCWEKASLRGGGETTAPATYFDRCSSGAASRLDFWRRWIRKRVLPASASGSARQTALCPSRPGCPARAPSTTSSKETKRKWRHRPEEDRTEEEEVYLVGSTELFDALLNQHWLDDPDNSAGTQLIRFDTGESTRN